MKLKHFSALAASSLLILLIIAVLFNPPAKAAGSQIWHLSGSPRTGNPLEANVHLDPEHPDDIHDIKNIMSSSVDITPGEATLQPRGDPFHSGWWYLDSTPAQTDVTFGAADWDAHITAHSHVAQNGDLWIRIWDVDPATGDAVLLAYSNNPDVTLAGDGTPSTNSFYFDGSESQTVLKGHLIACCVFWNVMSGSPSIDINFGPGPNDSWIASPSSDPGYPAPELSTIILISLGLAAIAGFLYFRHRKAKALPTGS